MSVNVDVVADAEVELDVDVDLAVTATALEAGSGTGAEDGSWFQEEDQLVCLVGRRSVGVGVYWAAS